MKKFFISLTVALLSFNANAQVVNVAPVDVKLESKAVVMPIAKAKKAPAAVSSTTTQQRIVGLSTTEDIYTQVGLTTYPGELKVATIMPESIISAYAGAKVVGIKYAIAKEGLVSRVFITAFKDANDDGTQVVSQEVSNDAAGWNYIAIPADQQYTLETGTELMVGYDYTQVNSGGENSVYPICTVKDNLGGPLLIYANIPAPNGNGETWYNFGSGYGSACIQLVVEGDNFAENAVTPLDFSPFTIIVVR